MNKILLVTSQQEERAFLEEVLYEVVQSGGELFFAATQDQALKIVKQEKPQLIFVDKELDGPYEGHIVIICDQAASLQERTDYLIRPLQSKKILEKCGAYLHQLSGPTLPL